MALAIKWSAKAKANYDDILSYLNENWSKKEVEKFIRKTNSIINIISYQPYAFKASDHKNIRKAVLGKQNSLFYLIKSPDIYLLSFWDNRMDPKKNKY